MKFKLLLFLIFFLVGCTENIKKSPTPRKGITTFKAMPTEESCLNKLKNYNGVIKIQKLENYSSIIYLNAPEGSNNKRAYNVISKYQGIGLTLDYVDNKLTNIHAYDNRPRDLSGSKGAAGSAMKMKLLGHAIESCTNKQKMR